MHFSAGRPSIRLTRGWPAEGTLMRTEASGNSKRPCIEGVARSRARLLALMFLALSSLIPVPALAQTVAWTQIGVTGRSGHAMAYDTARGVSVIFGGLKGNEYSAETWEGNGAAWLRPTVNGPSPRSGHAMAYDAARGVTVLFGG